MVDSILSPLFVCRPRNDGLGRTIAGWRNQYRHLPCRPRIAIATPWSPDCTPHVGTRARAEVPEASLMSGKGDKAMIVHEDPAMAAGQPVRFPASDPRGRRPSPRPAGSTPTMNRHSRILVPGAPLPSRPCSPRAMAEPSRWAWAGVQPGLGKVAAGHSLGKLAATRWHRHCRSLGLWHAVRRAGQEGGSIRHPCPRRPGPWARCWPGSQQSCSPAADVRA